jgi:3-oxoacyl-[acyl-carrier protein] reductase
MARASGLDGRAVLLTGASGGIGSALAPALIADTGMFPRPAGNATAPPPPIPVGRLGTPDEVADLALAVLRNGYLTNQVLLLDGGIHPQ